MSAFVTPLLGWVLLLGGSVFVLAGGIGLLRFPDFYTRLHAAGVTDTLGAGLILLGLISQAGWDQISAKLLLIALLTFIASPTAAHALAKAARHAHHRPITGDGS